MNVCATVVKKVGSVPIARGERGLSQHITHVTDRRAGRVDIVIEGLTPVCVCGGGGWLGCMKPPVEQAKPHSMCMLMTEALGEQGH